MRWLTPGEFCDLPAVERRWLVPDLVPEGARILTVGAPKSGKSFLTFQMLWDWSAGRECLGYTPVRPLRVAYLDIDSPSAEIYNRVTKMLDNDRPAGEHFYLIHPDDIERPCNVLSPEGTKWINQVKDIQPDVVAMDVLREFHNLDEDKSVETKRLTDVLASAFDRRHMASFYNHHAKKLDPNLPTMDAVNASRGSGAISGWVDAIWLVTPKRWVREPRYMARDSLKMHQGPEGWWELDPDNPAPAVKKTTLNTQRVLMLCAANPDKSHAYIKGIAHKQFGMSGTTFDRAHRGHPCPRDLEQAKQNAVLSPLVDRAQYE